MMMTMMMMMMMMIIIIIIIIIIVMSLRMIFKTELNANNKITAIGALAVAVLRYSFGVISWRLGEINSIDRKAGKVLSVCTMLHSKLIYIDYT